MRIKLPLLSLFFIVLLAGCTSNLVHTWNIDQYKIIKENGQKTGSKNIGTMTFNKNGTGNKDISYTIFDHTYTDKAPFKWEKHEGYIILKSTKTGQSSRLDKAWIIIKDESKKQVWKSTDGGNTVQILVLSRN